MTGIIDAVDRLWRHVQNLKPIAAYKKFRSGDSVRKISDFFYSPIYIYALGIVTLALNMLGIDEITYAFLAVLAITVLLLCPDAMPAIAVLVFYTVARSVGNRNYAKYNEISFVFGNIWRVLVRIAIAFHIIVNADFRKVKSSRLLVGFIAVSAGLLVNGFLSPYYNILSTGDGIRIIRRTFVGYLVMRTCIKPTRETLRYFCYVALVYGLNVGIQLCATYFINKPFIESGFNKDSMLLGWGVSNTIGATLFVAMPFVFYLMYTEDKHAWYYFTAVTLMLIAQVFTYARASLLFTLPLFAAMYVLCLAKGKRRKQIAVCGIVAVVAVIAVAVIMKSMLIEMLQFFINNKFGDRGRFKLWSAGIELWKTSPVFGAGIHNEMRTQTYYHNTPLQFLVTGGILGYAGLALNHMQISSLFTQKPTIKRLFLAALTGGIVLISLLDNFYMYSAMQIFFQFAVVFAEHDLNKTLPFAYRYKVKNGKYKLLY